METLKELRARVKEIRKEQKPITKASAAELKAEIAQHVRKQNLMKARMARIAAKEDVVEIPKKEFVEEHTTLIKELKEAKPKVLKKEAEKQAKELAAVASSKKKVPAIEPEPLTSDSEGEPILSKYQRNRK